MFSPERAEQTTAKNNTPGTVGSTETVSSGTVELLLLSDNASELETPIKAGRKGTSAAVKTTKTLSGVCDTALQSLTLSDGRTSDTETSSKTAKDPPATAGIKETLEKGDGQQDQNDSYHALCWLVDSRRKLDQCYLKLARASPVTLSQNQIKATYEQIKMLRKTIHDHMDEINGRFVKHLEPGRWQYNFVFGFKILDVQLFAPVLSELYAIVGLKVGDSNA